LYGRGGGGRVGPFLRIFAASAAKKLLAAGSDLRNRGLLRLAVCGIRGLRRRSANGVFRRHGAGGLWLGNDRRKTAAAGVFQILERNQENFGIFCLSDEKNI